jgi:hypothetical protein
MNRWLNLAFVTALALSGAASGGELRACFTPERLGTVMGIVGAVAHRGTSRNRPRTGRASLAYAPFRRAGSTRRRLGRISEAASGYCGDTVTAMAPIAGMMPHCGG